MYRIAQEHGSDVHTIAKLNALKDPSLIRVGQKPRVPVKGEVVQNERKEEEIPVIAGKSLGEFTLTAYTPVPSRQGNPRTTPPTVSHPAGPGWRRE